MSNPKWCPELVEGEPCQGRFNHKGQCLGVRMTGKVVTKDRKESDE